MLFSGNLSNNICGGVISTYFVYAAVLHLLWVLGGGYWAKMGCCNGHDHGTKKAENHWFSATVSSAKTRTVIQDRTQGNPWEKRFTFG